MAKDVLNNIKHHQSQYNYSSNELVYKRGLKGKPDIGPFVREACKVLDTC